MTSSSSKRPPTTEEFVAEALTFLRENASPRRTGRSSFGEGSDEIAVIPERDPRRQAEVVGAAQRWARTVFDAGFGWITGPGRFGGRGLPRSFQRAYDDIEAGFATPDRGPLGIGLGMVAPTILAHGTMAVKDRYLRAIHRGDIIACQLFSEPSAGSDLASLSARAVRRADGWLLNGQKVWTSGAQYAHIGEVLCRSDLMTHDRHEGISALIVDMHAPGVEVRPLRQMTGGASFNEVFFTDVFVPDDHLLGEEGAGWAVARTTLMNERAAIGAGSASVAIGASIERLIEVARHLGLDRLPLVRQELADLFIRVKVADLTNDRAVARLGAGQPPGPELSVGKLALAQNVRRAAQVVSQILGMRLIADSGEWGTYAWARFVLGAPGIRIAGGTDEIMRNLVAERVLGLPRDPPIAPADHL